MNAPGTLRPADAGRLDANLDAARADVKAEIARTDAKASLMLAFVGAVLAGVWSAAPTGVPVAARVVGGAGCGVLVAVAGVLLWSVRPYLGGARPVGFPRWAALSADEVRVDLAGDDRAEHIAALSRIAVAKFTHLRRAVDGTCLAGGLLLAAVMLAVVGGAA